MNVIIAGIGDPAIVLTNGIDIGSIEGFDFVMRIDITQFKSMPQRIHPSGKICLIGRIHIGGIQVNHCAIFRVRFLTIPGHGKTIARTI
ncbi:Uncharacterised protein [Enterobacter cloacae]|nr:Uncharacterised protein [Enterobacter cloacae]